MRNCKLRSDPEDPNERRSSNDGSRRHRDDRANAASNTSTSHVNLGVKCVPQLRVFDWNDRELLWQAVSVYGSAGCSSPLLSPIEFAWTRDDAGVLAQLSVVIASDVLYDEATVRVFLRALQHVLLSSSRDATVVVALERRSVFSVSTMSVIALGYDSFHAHLCPHDRTHDHAIVTDNRVKCRQCKADAISTSTCSSDQLGDTAVQSLRFVAREYPVDDFPHVFDYDRPSTLMVWIIDAVAVEWKSRE